MQKVKRIFLPHEKHGHRAYAISHSAIFTYSGALFVFLFTFKLLLYQTGSILGYATNINVDEVYRQTNEERVNNGFEPLTLNEQLNSAAKKKAEDMFADDYWAHIAPDGTTPWEFIEDVGYDYFYAGENLARDFNDSTAVVRAWMNSPTHRDNLLGGDYQDIGIAVVDGVLLGHETTLVVQLFGGRRESQSAVASSRAVEITPSQPVPIETEEETGVLSRPSGVPQLGTPKVTAVETSSTVGVNRSAFGRMSVMIFAIFLLSLFALDMLAVARSGVVRLSGSTVAHIALLLFLIFVAWWANVGVIL